PFQRPASERRLSPPPTPVGERVGDSSVLPDPTRMRFQRPTRKLDAARYTSKHGPIVETICSRCLAPGHAKANPLTLVPVGSAVRAVRTVETMCNNGNASNNHNLSAASVLHSTACIEPRSAAADPMHENYSRKPIPSKLPPT